MRIDDLLPVAQKYVARLFDFKQCNISIICHPSKLNDTISAFEGYVTIFILPEIAFMLRFGCKLQCHSLDDNNDLFIKYDEL